MGDQIPKRFWEDNGQNLTKTLGTNIIGGAYLGGNYWSDYNGIDTDGDGLGDTMLLYNCGGNIQNSGDWLPLTNKTGEPDIRVEPSHLDFNLDFNQANSPLKWQF